MFTHKDLETMLGLSAPWKLQSTEIDHTKRNVTLKVACEATHWGDPESGRRLHIHSHEERRWRHLDFWQYECVIIASVPRVLDPETGKTQMVAVPWAGAGSRWTLAFEALALAVIQVSRSLEDARRLLRLNWESARKIMQRAVERGLARREEDVMSELGVDEKSFGKGQDFISVLTDIGGKRVLDVVRGADKPGALALLETLSWEQSLGVEAVAMDRSPTFIAAVSEALPGASIVHDPYHLSADINKAVDLVRRQEQKVLLSLGDNTLTGTKFHWLRNPMNMAPEKLASFSLLASLALKTSRAWGIKELFGGYWEQPDAAAGERYFAKWYARTIRSRLEPMKKLARSFRRSLPNMLTWFAHRISNAMAEGFNSVIQIIKAAARGFRNFANYRISILFRCGKLDLGVGATP
jgi:transposase